MDFSWDTAKNEEVAPAQVNEASAEKEEVKRYMLEDDLEEQVTGTTENTRTILSPEEQQRKMQERMTKIQEYTAKLKKADGIIEFENEPAFVRRNIQLDDKKFSSDDSVSRFGVSTDENGNSKLRGNSFLHDNVD